VVVELIRPPLSSSAPAIEVAAAHLYEQSRQEGFNRLATSDALMAGGERLAVKLVNGYRAVKPAGLISCVVVDGDRATTCSVRIYRTTRRRESENASSFSRCKRVHFRHS